MITIDIVWNSKMINYGNKLNFLDKKVQDMINYFVIISLLNNKKN